MPAPDQSNAAIDQCVEVNYAALKSAAHWELQKESPSFSINSDDLLHLAYESLADRSQMQKLEARHLIKQFRIVMHNICRNRRRSRASRRKRQLNHARSHEHNLHVIPSHRTLEAFLGQVSPRQAIVTHLYVRGTPVPAIADMLALSTRTVQRDLSTVNDAYHSWNAPPAEPLVATQ